MIFVELNGRRYAQFESLAEAPGLAHAFATRPLDVSVRRDERAEERAARRARMARDLGFDPERLSYCDQVHQTELVFVEGEAPGRRMVGIDALATRRPLTPLMTFSADCPLVLVYDPRVRAFGMVHASWRCTVGEATAKLVRAMVERFGCRQADLCAGIGPSAGPCCYEVQDDVREAAAALADRDSLFPRREGRMFFDLWRANAAQLVEAGVSAERIEQSRICTLCRNDLFYSFRREGLGCGHFGLMAGLV